MSYAKSFWRIVEGNNHPFILICVYSTTFFQKKLEFSSLSMFDAYKLISEAIHLCSNDVKDYFSILFFIGATCDREFENVSMLHDVGIILSILL